MTSAPYSEGRPGLAFLAISLALHAAAAGMLLGRVTTTRVVHPGPETVAVRLAHAPATRPAPATHPSPAPAPAPAPSRPAAHAPAVAPASTVPAPPVVPKPAERSAPPVDRRVRGGSPPAPPPDARAETDTTPDPAPALAATAPREVTPQPRATETTTVAERATPPPVGSRRDELARFVAHVREAVIAHRRYPSMARRRGIEGEVVARVEIDSDGLIRAIEIIGEAPPVLTRATEKAIHRAAPFPAPPKGPRTIELALDFSLRDG